MKRLAISLMILGLIIGMVATAEAKKAGRKRVERTVVGSYDTQFVPFSGMVTHVCRPSGAIGCVSIQTRANEAFLSAKVTDAHGQPVAVTVRIRDTNSESWVVYGGRFCGETEEPIPFPPGAEIFFDIGYFWLDLPHALASCPPMFGTKGTVAVTLSNIP